MWQKNDPFPDWSTCMNAGYIHSKEFMESLGPALINEKQLFIKFYCEKKVNNTDQTKPPNIGVDRTILFRHILSYEALSYPCNSTRKFARWNGKR